MASIPIWAQWISTLAMPTIAVVGIFIAWQQWRLARHKLSIDLFDKRYSVYIAAKSFVSTVQINNRVELNELLQFGRDTRQATFLFDKSLVAYLKDVEQDAWNLRQAIRQTESAIEISKRDFYQQEDEQHRQLNKHLEIMDSYFAPYLNVNNLALRVRKSK